MLKVPFISLVVVKQKFNSELLIARQQNYIQLTGLLSDVYSVGFAGNFRQATRDTGNSVASTEEVENFIKDAKNAAWLPQKNNMAARDRM